MTSEVVEYLHTCYGSPAQWNVRLADGRAAYLRYRWGRLTAAWFEQSDRSLLAYNDAPYLETGEDFFERQLGDDLDGYATLEEVCFALGWKIHPKAVNLCPEM